MVRPIRAKISPRQILANRSVAVFGCSQPRPHGDPPEHQKRHCRDPPVQGSGHKRRQSNHGDHHQQTLQASGHSVSSAISETLGLTALGSGHGAQPRGPMAGARHGCHLSAWRM